MKHPIIRKLVNLMIATGAITGINQASAAGFQLWEQDGASPGNYHAGYAAEANDASTTWYNPAGIPRIKNQQLVLGVNAIDTDFKYKGNLSVTEITLLSPIGIAPATVTINGIKANGGAMSYVPNLEYVAPINETVGFGLSVVVPFGLRTDYGRETALRYAATRTGIKVVDISPSLGIKITPEASIGIGIDLQRAEAEFNSYGALIDSEFVPITEKTIVTSEDTKAKSRADDTAYGYHLGVLYEFNPETRVGLSYHSAVSHHFTGKSTFIGPIANSVNDDHDIISRHAKANVKLPAYTALSAYHQVNPYWTVMGSVIYTQWDVFKNLRLQNVAGVVNDPITLVAPSTTMVITIPEHYKNSWNASLGANYIPNEKMLLRAGVGYDQTPVTNDYRNVQLPDSDRYILALGGHYQMNKTVAFDLSFMHVFIGKVKVNPPPQVMGAETVTTVGKVSGGANVISGQVTWNIT